MIEKTWLNDCVSMFEGFREYNYGDIRIFISNTETVFEAGQHKHAEYEFMLVREKDVTTFCNGNRFTMEKGHIMPFNSFDIHGQETAVTIESFVCMIFSADLIKKIAFDAFRFEQQPLFENKSFLPSPNLNIYLGVLVDEYNEHENVNSFCQNLLKKLIIMELFKCSNNNVVIHNVKQADSISRAKKYLDDNFQLHFDLQKTADIAGMNKYYFVKRFKEEVHKTPQQYLLQLKIDNAKKMIALGKKNLTNIAFELGFSSQSHFITQFKKITGITPGEFKKIIL